MGAEKLLEIKMEEIKESVFYVRDLDCSNCAMKVESEISKLIGVEKAAINFSTAKLSVSHVAGQEESIIKELEKLGHPGTLINNDKKFVEFKKPWYLDKKTIMTWFSGLFLIAGLLINLLANSDIAVYLYVLSIIIGGYHVGKSGLYALKTMNLDMNALMFIAVVGAAILGEWVEGAAVVFLFSLGNTLQTYTMDKTRNSIRSLMELAPNVATKKSFNREIEVAVEDLQPQDIIIIKPGERVPMDGTIIRGYSQVNQAPITGESIPVDKRVGDELFAGTINGNGLIEMEVTKMVEDTTLARIMKLVEEAQSQKAPTEQLVDKFAKYYTPLVVALAVVITFVPPVFFELPFEIWFKRALILLVIACPCALVISTPVSIVSAIGNASKRGILIKGGAYLEEFGRIKAFVFDKTGTLTIGKPVVLDVISIQQSMLHCLKIAANIEKGSEHTISKAFISKAREEGIELDLSIEDFQSIPGKGVMATIDGEKYILGNRLLLKENKIDITEYESKVKYEESKGRSVIFLANSSCFFGMFVIADRVREQSKDIVRAFKDLGVDNLYMLSGDNHNTAKALAEEIGFTNYIGELLPQDKLEKVKGLLKQHNKVAMIGDGINDTPALSLATVGVAMGVAGTDAALETANIALMGDDLSKLPYAVALSRMTLKVIQQNIFFSVVVKIIFMILTFLGLSNLWMAVFADTGASIIVILNSMRLLKFKTR